MPAPLPSCGTEVSVRVDSIRSYRIVLLSVTIIDTLAVILAATLAWNLPGTIPFFPPVPFIPSAVTIFVIAEYIVLLAVLKFVGGYDLRDIGAGSAEYRAVITAQALAFGGWGIIAYLWDIPLSRTYFLVLLVVQTIFLLLGRFIFRRILHHFRDEGHFMRRALIAGSPTRTRAIAEALAGRTWLGLLPVASFLSADYLPTTDNVSKEPVFQDLARAVKESDVEVLVIADGFLKDSAEFSSISWALESLHVSLIVMPAVSNIAQDRIHSRPVAGLPFMWVEQPRSAKALSWVKRLFDLVGAGLGTLLISPFLLIVAFLIKVHDGGPVIFSQTRIGVDGEPFKLLKFRSMVENAEELRAELVAEHGGEGLFKMAKDPRVTPIGRFIRRHSIDELPQLFNVLRGEMSLVGPRPALPEEVDTYSEKAYLRLRVRPGMTGLWQVSGRSDLDWDETVRLDLYYVDNWSMLRDIMICLRTIGIVVGGRGAY
nr:sugar transferase [Bowdeniella massiliensis]